MISIVIPAHDEESVISRCLCALLDGVEPGEIEIIVSCNGCTDRTADIARSFGSPVKVLEIDKASKTAALNAADKAAKFYPRFYVDADVILSLESVRKIASFLQQDGALLASPVASTDTSASSLAVRAFYDIWLRLPYNRVMVGTGVYALSEQGRRRFGEFPSIIADDGFVRSCFLPEERMAVMAASVKVFAPRTLSDLIRVKTRSRLGGYELAAQYPQQMISDPKRLSEIIKSLFWSIFLPWKLFIYIGINVVVRLRAKYQQKHNINLKWERDHTSRDVRLNND